jgi:hypothetical protein
MSHHDHLPASNDKKKEYFENMKLRKEEKDWTDEFTCGQGYCLVCGHDDPLDIEYHHIGAQSNSAIVVSLCRNCHGKLSRKQMRNWPDGWSIKNKPKNIKPALLLRGISDLLIIVGRHLRFISDEMLSGVI